MVDAGARDPVAPALDTGAPVAVGEVAGARRGAGRGAGPPAPAEPPERMLAASCALIETSRWPLEVRRSAIARYFCSRSFMTARSGEAMKIDEYAPDSSPTVRATP